MKKLVLCLLILGAFGTAYADNERVTTQVNVLPNSAQNFIRKHFSALSVQTVTIGNESGQDTYEVLMSGDVKINFNYRGNWTKVDCNGTSIPESVCAPKMIRFLIENYPGQYASSVEKDRDGVYNLTLFDGTELKFNNKGDHLRLNGHP